jgi:N-acetylglucosamine kinase-like BadF-type ATPase
MVAPGQSTRPRPNLKRSFGALRNVASKQALAAADELRHRGSDYVDGQKQRVSENISVLAAALRRAAEKLNDSDAAGLAQYVVSAADGVDGVARYISEQKLEQLASEIAEVARKNPALVLGGLFLTGVTVGRFAKATSPRRAASRRRH